MKKFKLYFRIWRRWTKYNRNCKCYQFLVLIGIINSQTFNLMLMFAEADEFYKKSNDI